MRRALLHDAAVVKNGDAVGHGQGLALIVGDEDKGDTERPLQALQLLLHLLAQLQIERAKRFVEQQYLRFVDQGTSERHTLPLAAGELTGAAGAIARQFHQLQRLFGGPQPLGLAGTLDHQPVGDVVEDIEMRKERIVLEDRVDVAPVGRHAFGGFAEDFDMATCRLLETGDQPEAGGLAGAGRAEHGEEFAGRDFQVDAVHSANLAEMARHLLETNGVHWFLQGKCCFFLLPNGEKVPVRADEGARSAATRALSGKRKAILRMPDHPSSDPSGHLLPEGRRYVSREDHRPPITPI